MGHIVPAVLLPSSRPHRDICIEGLGGRVEVIPMARASRHGVVGYLLVGVQVGVRLGLVHGAVDVTRMCHSALVSKGVPHVLVDL